MRTLLTVVLTLTLVSGSLAQSKEQREAAKDCPLVLRVTAETGDSKSTKSGKGGGSKATSVKTMEKRMKWQAVVSSSNPSFAEKVELKAFYVGSHDGDVEILGKDTHPVEFTDGKCVVDLVSPTAKLVKKTIRKGGGGGRRRGGNVQTKTETSGDRINGLVLQLCVNGIAVKTFASKPNWAKAAWDPAFSEESLLPPNARR